MKNSVSRSCMRIFQVQEISTCLICLMPIRGAYKLSFNRHVTDKWRQYEAARKQAGSAIHKMLKTLVSPITRGRVRDCPGVQRLVPPAFAPGNPKPRLEIESGMDCPFE